jgi:hypothetical protein
VLWSSAYEVDDGVDVARRAERMKKERELTEKGVSAADRDR